MENTTYFQRVRILVPKGFQVGGIVGTILLIIFTTFIATLAYGSEPPNDRISFLLTFPVFFESSMIIFLVGMVFVCLTIGFFKKKLPRALSFLLGLISASVITIGFDYFYWRISLSLHIYPEITFPEFIFSGYFGREPFWVKLLTSPFLGLSFIIILTLSYVGWKLADENLISSKRDVLKSALVISTSCILLLCIPYFSLIEFLLSFFAVVAFMSAKSIEVFTGLTKKELSTSFAVLLGTIIGLAIVLFFNKMIWVGMHNFPDRYFHTFLSSGSYFPFQKFISPGDLHDIGNFIINVNPFFIPSLFGLLISIYVAWNTNKSLALGFSSPKV